MRHGNKTVISQIWPDDQMPYLTTGYKLDKYGVKHPVGIRERVDCLTNELAILNRTIPIAIQENSITFIIDRTRKHAATLSNYKEAAEFIIDVIRILNKKEGQEVLDLYNKMSEREKKELVDECISLNEDGTLNTSNGIYIRWEAFSKEQIIRDNIIELYEKYPDVYKPYEIFVPKPRWGRDIHIGCDNVGYQYIMMLKQSGEKGFIVRAGGAISDEGLPEKTNSKKIGTSWKSSKPIKFGEYDTPGFLTVAEPMLFALATALYRSSLDGRRYMCEAVLSDDGYYHLPDYFVSRTVEVLKVYFKSLGVGMDCIDDNLDVIAFPEDEIETVVYELQDCTFMCSIPEKRQLMKLHKLFRRYLKDNRVMVYDIDDVWDYIYEHLPFKKKEMLENVPKLFEQYLEYFARTDDEDD